MELITDAHAHYDDEAFDNDRDSLLCSLKDNGIGNVINVGAALKGCRDSILLAEKYPFVFAAVGVHPSETGDLTDDDLASIEKMAGHEKTVAIGEIGLDYHFPDDPSPEHQKEWFIKQLRLAKKLSLPVIIHSRDAGQDTLEIIRSEKDDALRGVMHCYSYSAQMAEDYLKLGFYFGIGGVLTFKNGRKLKEAAAIIPMERILLETDCPYLAPEPYRGKRNCSLYLDRVVSQLSDIKGISEEEVIRITSDNAKKLFWAMQGRDE